MKTRKEIIRAAIKLAMSYDGQRVVYVKDAKRLALLRAKIYRGASQDAAAFEKDMLTALGTIEGGRRRFGNRKPGKSTGSAKAITA
jgi:hypothetical protein